MGVKVLRSAVAIGVAGLVAAVAAATGGAGKTAKLKCQFGQRDLVCLLRPVLGVTPGPQSGNVRRIKPGARVAVKRKGQATVLLAREAQCHILARGRRTILQTRTPSTALFTQVRGETLCTISGEEEVFVAGQAAGGRSTSAVKFAAVLKSQDGNDPVQVRIRYRAKSSVGIALRQGGMGVRLSTGRELGLGGGDEMRAELTQRNTIKPGSLRVEGAHFDEVENGFFQREERSWFPLTVNIGGSGGGTVVSSPPGIDCGNDDCEESYTSGTMVSLTARPFDGSEFAGWGGDCAGAKTRCTVTMKVARSITAVFTSFS